MIQQLRNSKFGLDSAGKTTVLYTLKFGEQIIIIRTIAFKLESIEFKGFNLNVSDVGGQRRLPRVFQLPANI
jgi:GTPase SAR1 family protein